MAPKRKPLRLRFEIGRIRKHIAVLNDDYSKMVERVAKIETDMEWVKKLQWAILLSILTTVGLTVAHIWFSKP